MGRVPRKEPDRRSNNNMARCGMGVVRGKNNGKAKRLCVMVLETPLSYITEEQPHGRAARLFTRRPLCRAWQRVGVPMLPATHTMRAFSASNLILEGSFAASDRPLKSDRPTKTTTPRRTPGCMPPLLCGRRGARTHTRASPRVLPVSYPGHDVRLHVRHDVAPPLSARGELLRRHLLLLAAGARRSSSSSSSSSSRCVRTGKKKVETLERSQLGSM